MLTLYTAVGSLQFVNVNGKPVPHVINNQKEYGMSKEELLVWSCLAFQILTYPELERLFEKNCADSGQSISLPLSHYLNRLLLRGLLVKGMGVSAVDALYRLLGTLTITPVEDRFLPRLASVFLLYTKGQVQLKDIPRLLRKTKCTPTEREVLALAGKASLSTAELLLSMERGVLIQKEEDILEKPVFDQITFLYFPVIFLSLHCLSPPPACMDHSGSLSLKPHSSKSVSSVSCLEPSTSSDTASIGPLSMGDDASGCKSSFCAAILGSTYPQKIRIAESAKYCTQLDK